MADKKQWINHNAPSPFKFLCRSTSSLYHLYGEFLSGEISFAEIKVDDDCDIHKPLLYKFPEFFYVALLAKRFLPFEAPF